MNSPASPRSSARSTWPDARLGTLLNASLLALTVSLTLSTTTADAAGRTDVLSRQVGISP